MHYVSAEGLTKSYGIKPLFESISFHISEGDKIALVARNGAGKSTLLKIIAGQDQPEEGKVWINKDAEVAFFEQNPTMLENRTVLDNIFNHAHPVLNAIKRYEAALEGTDDHEITECLSLMDDLGAWDFEAKVR
jgi:ABC transport system ATP-binding/permease protein